MSYDLKLTDPVTGQCLELDEPHQIKGGNYQEGGTTRLWLNVTYNYAGLFCNVIHPTEGIRFLYGKSGAESIAILTAAIGRLGNDVDSDYWKATEGNAKRALIQLLAFAEARPEGIWSGD